MHLGKIVRKVIYSRLPEDVELALLYPVLDPVVTHVNGLGPTDLCSPIGDVRGSSVVRDDRSGSLAVTEILKCANETSTVLSVKKQGGIFGFRCGGHDGRYDAANTVDGSINWC
jgi:hypothetical protein